MKGFLSLLMVLKKLRIETLMKYVLVPGMAEGAGLVVVGALRAEELIHTQVIRLAL